MKKELFFLMFSLTVATCFGQNDTLAPMVLSSSGNYATLGNIELAYTVGEPVIETFTYAPAGPPVMYLTQGFHQPISKNALSFGLNFVDESCLGSKDGSALLNISGGTAPYTIVWSSNPTNNSTAIGSLSPGTYTVTVTDAHGLNKSSTFTILASESACQIHIYTGITPNGDGHNDSWVIDNIEQFPSNSVSIFNRWGSKVWSADGYNNTTIVWKGDNASGQPLPDATYFYIVNVAGKTYKGWVELTR